MKTNEKMKISEAITKVESGFGSIYSKEDVLNLLNNLELNGASNNVTAEKVRDLCNRIKTSIIENNDIIRTDDIELSIGYNHQIEIDEVPLNEGELESIFEYEMNQFIDDNFIIEDESLNCVVYG